MTDDYFEREEKLRDYCLDKRRVCPTEHNWNELYHRLEPYITADPLQELAGFSVKAPPPLADLSRYQGPEAIFKIRGTFSDYVVQAYNFAAMNTGNPAPLDIVESFIYSLKENEWLYVDCQEQLCHYHELDTHDPEPSYFERYYADGTDDPVGAFIRAKRREVKELHGLDFFNQAAFIYWANNEGIAYLKSLPAMEQETIRANYTLTSSWGMFDHVPNKGRIKK